MTNPALALSSSVAEALDDDTPIVALESTIITHGMPYPANVETALAVEAAVIERGGVPATIAVIDGRLRVGLDHDELDLLGSRGEEATKVSRRDVAYLVARRGTGGTTVAATMLIAHMAGIDVFATGGIGGVHHNAGETFDISADLQELARTDVAVVCAGFKSILDLGLTLEYLETHGVPVLGYGTDTLPAFYTRDSDHELDQRVDTPDEVAVVMAVRRLLGLTGGMVVANPIPVEHSLERSVIDAAIAEALRDGERLGVEGKNITPFLLSRIVDITGRASLDANVALVVNNARVATDIAAACVNRR